MNTDNNLRFRPGKKIRHRKDGGSVILFDPEEGRMAVLNETGSHLWLCLVDSPKSVQDLVEEICRVFEISIREAYIDIKEIVSNLHGEGWLVSDIQEGEIE